MPNPTDPNAVNWQSNPLAAGNTQSAVNWYQGQGYQWTPSGWQTRQQLAGNTGFGWGGFTGSAYGTPTAYPSRRLPPWMAPMSTVTGEAQQEFGNVPSAFDTSAYAKTVQESLGDISTASRNAASDAAAEYANKLRQAGGTTEGAGLIKAEGITSAQSAIAQAKTQAAQFELEQREKAATLSSQIADNLGNLRNNYLGTLAGYATKEDQLAVDALKNRGTGAAGSGNNWAGVVPNAMGLASGLQPVQYNQGAGEMATSANPMAGTSWTANSYGMGGATGI